MFKEILGQIVERTEGAIGALIMGTDGIPVEKVLKPATTKTNLDATAAEFTSLIRNAQRAGTDSSLGALSELVVSLDGANFVVRLFNKDYFVVLAVQPDGNLGRGRYELRKAELDFAHEFVV